MFTKPTWSGTATFSDDFEVSSGGSTPTGWTQRASSPGSYQATGGKLTSTGTSFALSGLYVNSLSAGPVKIEARSDMASGTALTLAWHYDSATNSKYMLRFNQSTGIAVILQNANSTAVVESANPGTVTAGTIHRATVECYGVAPYVVNDVTITRESDSVVVAQVHFVDSSTLTPNTGGVGVGGTGQGQASLLDFNVYLPAVTPVYSGYGTMSATDAGTGVQLSATLPGWVSGEPTDGQWHRSENVLDFYPLTTGKELAGATTRSYLDTTVDPSKYYCYRYTATDPGTGKQIWWVATYQGFQGYPLFGASVLPTPTATPVGNFAGVPKRWGFLGSSTTANYKATNEDVPYLMMQILNTNYPADPTFYRDNQAVSGSGTADFTGSTSTVLAARASFVTNGVTAVSIAIGSNNANATVPVTNFPAQINGVVATWRAYGYPVYLYDTGVRLNGNPVTINNIVALNNACAAASAADPNNVFYVGGDTLRYQMMNLATLDTDMIHQTKTTGNTALSRLWTAALLRYFTPRILSNFRSFLRSPAIVSPFNMKGFRD